MWTEITRPQYERSGLRYASDLTDKEWKVIAPHLPARKRHGRPRTTDLREVLNAILYMARTGCQWRMLPREFPPRSTVQRYFYAWRSFCCPGDGWWRGPSLGSAATDASPRTSKKPSKAPRPGC